VLVRPLQAAWPQRCGSPRRKGTAYPKARSGLVEQEGSSAEVVVGIDDVGTELIADSNGGCPLLRWIAGASSDAKGRLRKLRGHRDMKSLLAASKAKSAKVTEADRRAAWHQE